MNSSFLSIPGLVAISMELAQNQVSSVQQRAETTRRRVSSFPLISRADTSLAPLRETTRGEDGYRGSVYPVRRDLWKIQPARERVYQEVIYEPGEDMPVDWGNCERLTIGPKTRRDTGVWFRGSDEVAIVRLQ